MWDVLLVEDDPGVAGVVCGALEGRCRMRTAASLAQAYAALAQRPPDLILLDVSLPDGEGYELCAAAQRAERTRLVPIVFLTGRSGLDSRVTAFELGADDYIEKPFHVRELRARVEAKLAKLDRLRAQGDTIALGPLRIDRARFRAFWAEANGERPLDLTPHEFRLLLQLATAPGQPLSRAELLRAVWGDTVVAARTVDTHMSNLRKKLGGRGEWLQNVRGVGYRLVPS